MIRVLLDRVKVGEAWGPDFPKAMQKVVAWMPWNMKKLYPISAAEFARNLNLEQNPEYSE